MGVRGWPWLRAVTTAATAIGSAAPATTVSDARHVAQFSEVTVHFTMTTHVGNSLDLRRAVRRLLEADVAVSAAWPSESDVRVTPGLRSLASALRTAQRLRDDFLQLQQEKTIRSYSRFVLRHPLVVARNFLGRRTEPTGDSDGENGLLFLDQAMDIGWDVVFGAQKIAAVEREVDASLFGGRSRDRDEFVRLTLRGSYHDLGVPGVGETFHVVFEPRLMLHTSGVVQLTVAIPVDRDLTTSQLVQLSRSDRAVVVRSEMAEPLLAGLQTGQLRGRWLDERDAGARLREIIFDERVTIAESLERYLVVVGETLGKQIPQEWNTYATVFAAAGRCCDLDEWATEHQDDLSRVVLRYGTSGRLNLAKLIGKDFSLDPDAMLKSNLASTTRIQLRGNPPAPIDHLNTVLLVEHVLLQYFQLRALEEAVSRHDLFGERLQAVQHEAVAVFSHMRQHEIRYGSAREIATHLLSDLGGDQMRHTIESALALAAQANATHDASILARRSLALGWLGTVLAILVSVPALSELLSLAEATPTGSTLRAALAPLIWAATFESWGPWLVVVTLPAGAIALWLSKRLFKLAAVVWRVIRRIGGGGTRMPSQFVLDVQLRERPLIADDTAEDSRRRGWPRV